MRFGLNREKGGQKRGRGARRKGGREKEARRSDPSTKGSGGKKQKRDKKKKRLNCLPATNKKEEKRGRYFVGYSMAGIRGFFRCRAVKRDAARA